MISPGRWRCGYVATASLVPSLTAKRSFTLPSLCPQNTSSRRPLLARPLSSLTSLENTNWLGWVLHWSHNATWASRPSATEQSTAARALPCLPYGRRDTIATGSRVRSRLDRRAPSPAWRALGFFWRLNL